MVYQNKIISKLSSDDRNTFDLISWLRVRHPRILKEYEQQKEEGLLFYA